MATLKGQNFRVITRNGSNDWVVVAKSTNCTVTLTNNTDDASHKDIVGAAAMPEVISQAWSVQVDSLDVLNIGALLTAIKNNTLFDLIWDETRTNNNQTSSASNWGRRGKAYLNDATFNFNNRENSAKSIQFTGSGALDSVYDIAESQQIVTSDSSFTKGQFVRLYLGSDNTAAPSAVIASALNLSLHVSVTLESASTKDTEGTFDVQEPTGYTYDISTSALIRGNDTITSSVQAQGLEDLESIFVDGTPVKWLIANVSGANQRTKGTTIVSGSCIVQSLTLNGPNRQNATYDASLAGYGPYTVGA